jgi:hypothetical protein
MFAVVAASLLASCKDEGGVLDAFFRAQGSGDCERITVTVDMQSADALLAPPVEGREECALYSVLEAAGCDFEMDVIDDGRLLRVVIDDCRIDDHSGLFRCAFSDGELEDLSLHTTAVCDCFGPSCDDTPRLCVSDDSEDTTCEIPGESTTSTSSTSTSTSFGNSTEPTMLSTTTTLDATTTTIDGVTTTTFPVEIEYYSLVFRLDSASGLVGALQWRTDYSAANIRIVGSGAQADCDDYVGGTLFAKHDKDVVCSGDQNKVCNADNDCTGVGTCTVTPEELTLGLVSVDGFAAPTDLVSCSFEIGSLEDPPVPGDFRIVIEDAVGPMGEPISVSVSVLLFLVP